MSKNRLSARVADAVDAVQADKGNRGDLRVIEKVRSV